MVIHNVTPLMDPEADVWIEKENIVFSNLTVRGTYTGVGFMKTLGAIQGNAPAAGSVLPDPKGFTGSRYTLTLDGFGGGSVTEVRNLDGVISSSTTPN